MDGIVKKIGSATGEEDMQEDDSESFGLPWKVDPMTEEESNDPAFAIIEGEGGVEVICTVSELNLPKVQPGTRLEVMSYMNGAHSFAEVISVDDTPVSYTAQNWGDNPQNSSYQVHARL